MLHLRLLPLETRTPGLRIPPPGGTKHTPLLLSVVLALAACGGEGAPALEVGDRIRYSASDLAGLSQERRLELGVLAGFGLAVSQGELPTLGRPGLDRLEREQLVEALVDEVALRRAGVGDDVLRARYLTAPEYELEIRHLVFLAERTAPDSVRDEARRKAREALDRARAGEDFPALAGALSEEPGAAQRQGLLRPARRGMWVREFWDAGSALQVGELSGVVETQYGFHVLRLEGRTEVPFVDVRARVAAEVAGLLGGGEREAAREELEGEAGTRVEILPDGPALLSAQDRELEPGAPVARRDGTQLRLEEVLRYLAGRSRREFPDRRAAEPEALHDLIRRAAVEADLVDRALEAGMTIPDEDRESFQREWEFRTIRWSMNLGFRSGMTPDQVKAAARNALGATGQEARIAREELFQISEAVRLLHPFTLAGEDG